MRKDGFSGIAWLSYFLCISGAVIVSFPLIWMALTSLKTKVELTHLPITFFPKNFLNFDNYKIVLNFDISEITFARQPMGRALLNSFLISSIAVISSAFLASLAGFGFAKFNFFGKEFFFVAIISLLIIPFHALAVPLYLWVNKFGLIDTYPGVVLPFLVSAFGVYLAREAIAQIPNDYIDAARIDGCSYIRIFLQIILPNIKPTLIVLIIIKFTWTWNEFFWPLIVSSSDRTKVITVALSSFKSQHFTAWELMSAGAVASIVPVALLFILFQKWVTKGIIMSGIKG